MGLGEVREAGRWSVTPQVLFTVVGIVFFCCCVQQSALMVSSESHDLHTYIYQNPTTATRAHTSVDRCSKFISHEGYLFSNTPSNAQDLVGRPAAPV